MDAAFQDAVLDIFPEGEVKGKFFHGLHLGIKIRESNIIRTGQHMKMKLPPPDGVGNEGSGLPGVFVSAQFSADPAVSAHGYEPGEEIQSGHQRVPGGDGAHGKTADAAVRRTVHALE